MRVEICHHFNLDQNMAASPRGVRVRRAIVRVRVWVRVRVRTVREWVV